MQAPIKFTGKSLLSYGGGYKMDMVKYSVRTSHRIVQDKQRDQRQNHIYYVLQEVGYV